MKSRGLDYWKRQFLKKRFKYTVVFVCLVGILFLCFQMLSLTAITHGNVERLIRHLKVNVRGMHPNNAYKYVPNSKGNFVCHSSKQEIDFRLVNDNYCDCPADGSDEPGTNACKNAVFHCEAEASLSKSVPSNQVNDGICDCCDGSDEWAQIFFPYRISEELQMKLGRYHSPCPNLCPDDV
ncbi:uncharacterized protein LOC126252260 [Schistocerca nitens]|uniref:uncharacterized protein LOC126252260 n=1 Tax=Schistocerca nitens TaxID=7011 RepID=UPI002117894D|nr:uncharacterized protein LOC126252260 [Schistocerca nitens]